ncbi:hypothetical protein CRG98_007364, partial [Punica granatum]
MAEEDRVDISEKVNPPVPAHSQPPPTHAPPPPTPAGILPAYSGAPPTHLPPPTSSGAPFPRVSLTSSASKDQARITALEGTVNQLAASMTANMAELFALLRGPNRASSSSTPPPGQGPTVDPTQIPENIDALVPPTLHTSTAQPFTSSFPPPPAPTAVPLPLAAFLSSEQAPSAPPLFSIPAPAAIYTVPPPMDIPTWADLSRKFIDQYQYCAETPPTLLELSMKEMAHGQRFEKYATKWRAQAAKHIPPISEVQQIQLFHSTLRGVYYSHMLAHTSSFSDLIEAWKKLDLGIKLGKMEGPTGKGEEPSKKAPATTTPSSGQRGKEVSVNAVNPAHPTPQQYSVNAPQYQPPAPRVSQPTQRVPPPQGQQGGAAQPRPRRQYPSLPVPLSYIYQQIRNKIGTIAPGPNFYPTIQDQSKQCEYHRGAPEHTLDACWRLRERIQEMIDAKELVFNTVRSPNVQANPLPDHGPAREPSINMITICTSREGESEQDCPSPFVIEYVPT